MSTRPANTNRFTDRFFKAWTARCATVVSKDMRIPKKSLIALIGAGIAGSANGALIVNQNAPYEFGGNVNVDTTLDNQTGVTLDSATLDYSELLFGIANTDFNISRFDTNEDGIVDFDNDNLVSQLSPYLGFSVLSTGDVYNKWEGNIGSEGIVSLSASGLGKHEFNNNQDMNTRLNLGNYIVENPETNTIVPINLDSNATITDFATANFGGAGGVNFSADGLGYNVVPEPSQYAALAGALALGLAAYRRPKRKE